MPISLGNNIASLRTARYLNATTESLSQSALRLSSGLRINRASDDAASLAVAANLDTDSRIYGQAVRNVNDGISLLNVADGALSQLSSILQRQMELATEAANSTYSSTQRNALDREAQALSAEYNRIIQTTEFNGLNVLNGTAAALSVQAGQGSAATIPVQFLHATAVQTYAGLGTFTARITQVMGGLLGGSNLTVDDYAIGDFNGDGRSDVAVMFNNDTDGSDTGAYLAICLADSTGQLSITGIVDSQYTGSGSVAFTGLDVSIGDYNSDGKADLSAHWQSFDLVYLGDGAGNFGGGFGGTLPNNVGQQSTYDFNGDGVADQFVSGATTINTRIQNTTATTSYVTELTMGSINLQSVATAKTSLTALRTALTAVDSRIGELGSMQERLIATLGAVTTTQLNYKEASSRLTDADVATESAEYTRKKLLQQAAAAVLSQANLAPEIALVLLGKKTA